MSRSGSDDYERRHPAGHGLDYRSGGPGPRGRSVTGIECLCGKLHPCPDHGRWAGKEMADYDRRHNLTDDQDEDVSGVRHPSPLQQGSGVNPRLTTRASRTTEDFGTFTRRIIRAYGRRVANGELDQLASLVAARNELDQAIEQAVAALRHQDRSWSEIGRAVGIRRQSAQKRWGHLGGTRTAGGQPGHLR